MSTETRLAAIEARINITDALHRYCRALDRYDLSLLKAVFHPDAIFEAGLFNGPISGFVKAIDGAWGDPGTPWKKTHHVLTNVIIELTGERAAVESYFTAYHRADVGEERTDQFAGGRYIDEFQQRGGEWLIAHRCLVFDWSRIEPATADYWGKWDVSKFHFGTTGRSDPLYTCGNPA